MIMRIARKTLCFFIYLLTHMCLTSTESLQDNSIYMLNDFIKSKNLMLSLHTCWSKAKSVNFSKSGNYSSNNLHFFTFHGHFSSISLKTNKLILIMDLSNNCTSAWSTLHQINTTNSFISPIKYFILSDNILDLIMALRNYTVYPASDVIVAEKNESDYRLHGVYRINAISELIWETYGYWSSEFGLKEYLNKIPISRRRHDLKQQNLKVMIRITDNDTWNHLEDLRYPSVDSLTKLCYGSNRCIMDYCNANVTYVRTEDFGITDKNGKFNGIVAGLLSGEGDTSVNALVPTFQRLDAVAYMSVQSPYYIKFVLKKPSLSYIENIYVLVLDKTVWLVLVIILVVFAFAAFLILNIEAKSDKIGDQEKISVTDVILLALEVLSQQGTSIDPKRISGRILQLIFFMAFFFVFIVYSGNVVAMLKAQVVLKSSKELLQTKMTIASQDYNYMHFYVAQDKSELGKEINRRTGPKGYYSNEVGMENVRKGSFAFQVILNEAYNYMLENFTNSEICSTQEVDGYFEHLRAYHITQKRSPYKEIFRTGALKVDEHGLRQRNHIRWFVKPHCRTPVANYESVGLIETRMVFLLVLYGIILSVIFLILENAVYYVRKIRKFRVSMKLKRTTLFKNTTTI